MKYFTTTESTGWTEWAYGHNSIIKPSKNGFEIRLFQKYALSRSNWKTWNFNALTTNVKWCGVGRSNGPKVGISLSLSLSLSLTHTLLARRRSRSDPGEDFSWIQFPSRVLEPCA